MKNFILLTLLLFSLVTHGQVVRTIETDFIAPNVVGGTVDISDVTVNTTTTVDAILDEDNLASDSATGLATQQSIKAYADGLVTGSLSSIDNLTDVTITTPATGQLLTWNGSAWVNAVSSAGDISAWVTSTPYVIGNLVIESNLIYKALTNHTSGTFATDLGNNEWVELSLPHGTISIDAAQMNPAFSTPSHSEGLMYYDQNSKTLAVYNDDADVTHQLGQEMLARVRNISGATILNGKVVRIVGTDSGFPTIELADNATQASSNTVVGLVTHDIENNTNGYATFSGIVNGVNTAAYSVGDRLYVDSTAGGLTNVLPSSPAFKTLVGIVVSSHATTGQIGVRVAANGNDEATQNVLNGTILQDRDATLKTDGAAGILYTLEKTGGGDLSIYFDGVFSNFPAVSAATCTATDGNCALLTLGTDAVPQLNYVYILQSTNELTVSTSGWPSGVQYAPVATLIVTTQASTLADGPIKEHAWTDHLSSTDTGHLSHLSKWIRSQHATWLSGVAPTFAGSGTGSITSSFTSGQVLQLHEHLFDAQGSPADMYVVNTAGGYSKITDIASITADSLGGSLISRTYGLVFWGSVNEQTGDSKIFINLPSGSYAKNQAALVRSDLDSFQDFGIPQEFKGTGFLIHRMVVDNFLGTWTIYSGAGDDLRGQLPNVSAGGSVGVGTEFPDSLFEIFNTADSTKALMFDASGVTTGTTRTLTMPDGSGTLLLSEGLSGGQTLNGGTDASDDLTLDSTSNATKGDILIPNSSIGVGGAPHASSIFDIASTTKGTRPCSPMTTVQKNAIGTPATGLCVYDTDLNAYYQYDGTAWLDMGSGGGGGGGGGLDIFLAEDFEKTLAADLSADSDPTFLGTSGTFDGTLSDETTNPIAGDSSVKWVGHATAGNNDDDWISLPIISLDPKQRGKEVGVSFFYEWDGADDNMVFRAYCTTPSSVKLSRDLDQLKNNTEDDEFVTSIFVPSTCTALAIGFQVITGEVSKTLVIDDIQLSTRPFIYGNIANLTDWEAFTPTGSWTTNTVYTGFKRQVGDTLEVLMEVTFTGVPNTASLTVDLPSGLTIDTAKLLDTSAGINGVYGLVSMLDGPGGSADYIGRVGYNSSTSVSILYNNAASAQVANATVNQANPFSFSTSDLVTIRYSLPIVGWTTTTEHVITPASATSEAYNVTYNANFWDNTGAVDTFDISLIPLTNSKLLEWNDTTETRLVALQDVIVDITAFGGYTAATSMQFRDSSGQQIIGNDLSTSDNLFKPLGAEIKITKGDYVYFEMTNAVTRAGSMTISARPVEVTMLAAVPVQRTMYVETGPTHYKNDITTSGTAYTAINLDSANGDKLGSVSLDQLFLGTGQYEIIVPVGGYDGAGHVGVKLHDATATSDIQEHTRVSYDAAGVTIQETSDVIFNFTWNTPANAIEIQVQSGTGTKPIVVSRIKIKKIR